MAGRRFPRTVGAMDALLDDPLPHCPVALVVGSAAAEAAVELTVFASDRADLDVAVIDTTTQVAGMLGLPAGFEIDIPSTTASLTTSSAQLEEVAAAVGRLVWESDLILVVAAATTVLWPLASRAICATELPSSGWVVPAGAAADRAAATGVACGLVRLAHGAVLAQSPVPASMTDLGVWPPLPRGGVRARQQPPPGELARALRFLRSR